MSSECSEPVKKSSFCSSEELPSPLMGEGWGEGGRVRTSATTNPAPLTLSLLPRGERGSSAARPDSFTASQYSDPLAAQSHSERGEGCRVRLIQICMRIRSHGAPGHTTHATSSHLISDEAQPASARRPNAVIPGLPARAEPGIQNSFDLCFWIPGSATRPRNDELRFVTNQVESCTSEAFLRAFAPPQFRTTGA